MTARLAKHWSNDCANSTLPTATLRMDRLLVLQTTRGLDLQTVGLDGQQELLERATAAGFNRATGSWQHDARRNQKLSNQFNSKYFEKADERILNFSLCRHSSVAKENPMEI